MCPEVRADVLVNGTPLAVAEHCEAIKPESTIAGGSAGSDGQSGGSKQFETFYQSEGCSYFPHSWRNSIDAFYTNSDKDCIEICAEDWCLACSRVPHAVKKGQDLEILTARAALGKLAKTYRSCKK